MALNAGIEVSPETTSKRWPNKRQKPAPAARKTACQPCRMRKVKCDRTKPRCCVCESSGARCQYDREGESLTLQTATDRILDRIEKLQTDVHNLTDVSRDTCAVHSVSDHLPRTFSQSSGSIHERSILEPSRDFLQIPSHRTSSDTVLCWEIFGAHYGPNALIKSLFPFKEHGLSNSFVEKPEDAFNSHRRFKPLQEERIPALIDNFLQNVHTKNPLLDVEQLVKEGRNATQQGLGWGAWPCLVLLACALGSVAKPFAFAETLSPVLRKESSDLETTPQGTHMSQHIFHSELEDGDSYFLLASRRLGSLKHTILGAQAHFFAGVYLMYTLRPLLSWQYFYHASILFQLHLKTNHGIDGASGSFEIPVTHLETMDRKYRRLEQSLYWSCFKSECEFRVELPLPQSEISTFQHPNLFPTPPSPTHLVVVGHSSIHQPVGLSTWPTTESISPHSMNGSISRLMEEERLIKQHAKLLCREEESWYYYLTEIALRRIGNRIINTFFRQDRESWRQIKPLLRIALEFDVQVSSWSANLPSAMKRLEATSTIKAPMLNTQLENPGGFVSRELSWATENRILEMRSWLYQPFLYYFIHSSSIISAEGSSNDFRTSAYQPGGNIDSLLNPVAEMSSATISTHSGKTTVSELLNEEESATLHNMVTLGIECNLRILDVRSLQHRHHGLWYDLRALMCASLILLGIVKSGHMDWIPGGVEILWGNSNLENANPTSAQMVGGKIGNVLAQFEFWSGECPELLRHREVLLELVNQLRK